MDVVTMIRSGEQEQTEETERPLYPLQGGELYSTTTAHRAVATPLDPRLRSRSRDPASAGLQRRGPLWTS